MVVDRISTNVSDFLTDLIVVSCRDLQIYQFRIGEFVLAMILLICSNFLLLNLIDSIQLDNFHFCRIYEYDQIYLY